MYESIAYRTPGVMPRNGHAAVAPDGMQSRAEHLGNCEPLAMLTNEQLAKLETHGRVREFTPKTPIYLPTEPSESVYVLSDGLAKICHRTKDGKESILTFVETGEIFGERAIFESGPRDEYVESIEACKVILLPVTIMRQLIESRVDISIALNKITSRRRHQIETRLKNLLFLSNRERLIHLLLDLTTQFGVPHAEGVRLRIKLSHQDVANLIGSTRETVTVLLGQLKSEHSVSGGRQRIVLADPHRLAEEVGREFQSTPARIPGPHIGGF
ncbi:Crp/Fnr family transcriptional regulator [Planctomycetota bacterium]